jgi:y4mF family transcriptional regulator
MHRIHPIAWITATQLAARADFGTISIRSHGYCCRVAAGGLASDQINPIAWISVTQPEGHHTGARALGRAVRARRRGLRLTQQQLGELAGCGVAFLYELETGKATVRLDKVLAVLSVLGLSLRVTEGASPLTVAPELDEDGEDGEAGP